MRPQKNRGGTLKETVLWTNPNPTNSFASQTVVLSDDITNYDYIKVIHALARNNQNEITEIVPSTQLLMYSFDANKTTAGINCIVPQYASDVSRVRPYTAVANNQIKFWQSYGVSQGSIGASNDYEIPKYVIGMKY